MQNLCRSYLKDQAGGEITVKDAGGFGALVITKSITIEGTGVPASILAEQANAITIEIPFRGSVTPEREWWDVLHYTCE